jgi:hypothetical protein
MTANPADISMDDALGELRKIVGPHPQIIVDVRDCGVETRSRHGRIEYCAQVGMNGPQYTAPTMAKVIAQVWRAYQEGRRNVN